MTTTATRTLTCLHDARAVCWACSDQDPRWRSWRGGGDPPNMRRRVLPPVLSAPRVPLPVIEREEPRTLEGWRGWYARTFGKGRKS